MKTWRLVSGILSAVLFVVVIFQSCAAGFVEAVDEAFGNAGGTSGASGIMLAILLLAGGIVSIATREGGKGGSIATLILYGIAAIIGFTSVGVFGDIVIWAVWCLVCAALSVLSLIQAGKPAK